MLSNHESERSSWKMYKAEQLMTPSYLNLSTFISKSVLQDAFPCAFAVHLPDSCRTARCLRHRPCKVEKMRAFKWIHGPVCFTAERRSLFRCQKDIDISLSTCATSLSLSIFSTCFLLSHVLLKYFPPTISNHLPSMP